MQISCFATVNLLAAAHGLPAQLEQSAVGWFDLVAVSVLIIGLFRGRKRGMSEEILSLAQWISIVLAGSFFYETLGRSLARATGMNLAYSFFVSYAGIALAVKLLFTLVKHWLGEKIVGSDTFGGSEYYLGMIAGVIRFACILLTFLALMNAPYYSDAERAAENKKQADNFSDIRFPTFATVQQDIFVGSFTGQWLRTNAPFLLIQSVADNRPQGEGIGKQRQREVESIFNR
jgi:uncharacterized membrane protein required for colicin V production